MRKKYSQQLRLDCEPVTDVKLNLNCRDEIVPILRALQHVYSQQQLREAILKLMAADVNAHSRSDRGRGGMDYWQILVLAAVRLGCNLNYDKLQDLAEQHRVLRQMMGIGDWETDIEFRWGRIQENICLLRPETIEAISHLIVQAGHAVEPDAARTMRADSFVVETDIHYPTESSLIYDGLRIILSTGSDLAFKYNLPGFRQHKHLLKKVKGIARKIARISKNKGGKYRERLHQHYEKLLGLAATILDRAREAASMVTRQTRETVLLARLQEFTGLTQRVCDTARQRIIDGEKVPNQEKLFSLFETHTQLYKRGKAGQPMQFGRLLFVCEDGAGFITHHYLMPRDVQDRDVVVEQTKAVQERLQGAIEEASFDRGFHSPENQLELAEVINHLCLPKPGVKQSQEQNKKASVRFHRAHDRHAGVEATIGVLQSGNGLDRCRDRGERGFERYLALAILGRNLHTLGKLLIRREATKSEAARTRRKLA